MYSLRKWFYRPKKEDSSKLALFYWADEELSMVATELDSFDGRTDPERCSILVSQLRICQDKVLSICNDIMEDAIPDMRANRDFRAKFPDDVVHENLAGQLWFGAECLAAGSNIIHRETESASMRPLAKALTRALENVRCLLREQSLKNVLGYSDKVREALRIFDRLFAEFELCYVSAMVPIKSAKEYHLQQEIVVLFSETLIRALKLELVTQDMIDDYDPSLMFTIPRLAIVWGLLLYPDGPFNVERESPDMSELFRPFCNLLFKIRDLLWTLTDSELRTLEKVLCSLDEPKIEDKSNAIETPIKLSENHVAKYYKKHLNCKQFIRDFYAYNFGILVPESGIPESSENSLPSEESKTVKTSDKRQNIEFDLDFQRSADHRKSPEIQESETLVSGNFGMPDYDNVLRDGVCYYADDPRDSRNKDIEDSDDEFRTRLSNSEQMCANRMVLNRRKCSEECAYCSADIPLNIESCSCDHLTPSRELMRQVMGRVEIVPPGQGYSSSPENSPRAYHHGLLSHSFPTHPSSEVGRRKLRRHRKRLFRIEYDVSPSRCNLAERERFWNANPIYSLPLAIPRLQDLRHDDDQVTYSSCSSCQSISSVSSPEWDSTSPDTSSYNSECQDDEEIALALQAAEIASRNKARSRFKSSRDLLHKLFVCISGVADQLQTNFASDLRNILKSVFDMNCSQIPQPEPCDNSPPEEGSHEDPFDSTLQFINGDLSTNSILNDNLRDEEDRDHSSVDSAEEVVPDGSPTPSLVISEIRQENNRNGRNILSGPPEWMPDELSSNCMACKSQFTILRRRHHCRNCGKIFCSRCSSNSIPLPRYGHLKPVRVCNQCFMYQLTSLVMQRQL